MGPRWARRPEEGSPQESAGVPANTRERARKKANSELLTFVYWWWIIALCRTFLNNACGLVRKRTESCGLTPLRQHLMKPGGKALFALLQ